jgi:5'-nucleotidase
MGTKPTIFLDLDGVMADFNRGFEELNGINPHDLEHDRSQIWVMIGQWPTYWEDLPLMPGAHDLWARVSQHDLVVLTGCPRDGYDVAAAGKRRWVARHWGPHIEVITCKSDDKQSFMRSPRDILIDDWSANIERWENAGGVGVHFLHTQQALAKFDEMMRLHHAHVLA